MEPCEWDLSSDYSRYLVGVSFFPDSTVTVSQVRADGTVIPLHQYFVMGDNRNKSQDSRLFGSIDRDRIDGKAWFRIWPLSHFGDIYSLMPRIEATGG